ncbi:hypothetical protein SDJN03_02396, partial [Cucurbita argyrosperma subsp. sororia]
MDSTRNFTYFPNEFLDNPNITKIGSYAFACLSFLHLEDMVELWLAHFMCLKLQYSNLVAWKKWTRIMNFMERRRIAPS